MMARVAIILDDEQKARLDALAETRQASAADLATEAVSEYLQHDAAFRLAVEEGLDAGLAGDVADFDQFAEGLRHRMAREVAKSGG